VRLVRAACPTLRSHRAQALLYGALPRGATLAPWSWELARHGVLILDDQRLSWPPDAQPLLLELSRPARLAEIQARGPCSAIALLKFWGDESKGGEGEPTTILAGGGDGGAPQTQGTLTNAVHSQVAVASFRLEMIGEYHAQQGWPDAVPLDQLLLLSTHMWRRYQDQLRRSKHLDLECKTVRDECQALRDSCRKARAISADLRARVAALEEALGNAGLPAPDGGGRAPALVAPGLAQQQATSDRRR
jgi:hypothetical protein